jgi:asparagine synthase (glutamine-hydrolysing)
MPGHILSLDLNTQSIKTEAYWNINTFYRKPKLSLSYQEAKLEVKNLMQSSFNYRMVADVPVGVFLSGGYDSTAVTAMLQTDSKIPLKTFTIGFEEGNNEAPYAKETAAYLGTDHTEYICTTKEAQDIIPTLPFFFDEPFGDSSAIPTILVSRLAKQQVTVALSADAGDEIFCGYQAYFNLIAYLKRVNKIPAIAGKSFSSVLRMFENISAVNSSIVYHQVLKALQSSTLNEQDKSAFLFQAMTEKPKGYIDRIFKSNTYSYPSSFLIDTEDFSSGLEVSMAIDFSSYLPNDILTKVDRASMSVSLEGREPLLDHRLAEFAAQLPIEFKYDGITGKRILKDIVHDIVPKEMMDRPKAGFSLPIYTWLRGDLEYLLKEYLSEEALHWSGLFDEKFLLGEVEKFKKNQLHYSPIVWYLLMFQMWYKKWM